MLTLLSTLIAAPFGLLTAVFLGEYAPRRLALGAKPLIDIFAGMPPVIYGIWGVMFIVPMVSFIAKRYFSLSVTGYSLLAAAIVVAVMIYPIITSVITELIDALPVELREASYSVGATRWQTVKHVVLRQIRPGIFAAIVLGLSRAFGETIAVMMVAGNVPRIPGSVFDPVYSLSALVANNYGEMTSIPVYDSALMFVSLLLLLIVVLFNTGAQLALQRTMRGKNL
jgi:phosphate transport system permease protein